ncbi:uncharacterized protein PV07_06054 [Cladophialophora immunda]|uniref:Uncharacterized protein n=1 Tax=Cladophialophora immunda TaxID=569365 RepID=A0A0D2D3J8_9EURO|nr:uncharacterized protein PV07_06054 [Cladophialophora immunda]KIW30299.1 hypothetical protein PV07_06054 [Cladophialophora immunda]
MLVNCTRASHTFVESFALTSPRLASTPSVSPAGDGQVLVCIFVLGIRPVSRSFLPYEVRPRTIEINMGNEPAYENLRPCNFASEAMRNVPRMQMLVAILPLSWPVTQGKSEISEEVVPSFLLRHSPQESSTTRFLCGGNKDDNEKETEHKERKRLDQGAFPFLNSQSEPSLSKHLSVTRPRPALIPSHCVAKPIRLVFRRLFASLAESMQSVAATGCPCPPSR